jgi:hypothetical protein
LAREMGGYVGSPPACNGSTLGSNPDISKIQKRRGQHTVARQKIYKKMITGSSICILHGTKACVNINTDIAVKNEILCSPFFSYPAL